MGIRFIIHERDAGFSCSSALMAVWKCPGATALTVTLYGAHYSARLRVIAASAPLAISYGTQNGTARARAALVMLMTRPQRVSSMAGTSSRRREKAPLT